MIEAAALQPRLSQLEPTNDENCSLKEHIAAHVTRPLIADSKKISFSSTSDANGQAFEAFTQSNSTMQKIYKCKENTNVAAVESQTNSRSPIRNSTNSTNVVANDDLNTNNWNSTIADSSYYEHRQKNNAASKISRTRRRLREDVLASRTIFLESQNIEYKDQLVLARRQIVELKNEIELVRKHYNSALQKQCNKSQESF